MASRAYHRDYSRNYYHKRRAELLSKLGGSCVVCGCTEDLQFDHIDPAVKSINIGKLLSYSKAVVNEEITKCQLLCKACHNKKTRVDVSELLRGPRNAFYGRTGADSPFSKAVKDLDTGEVFPSATDLACKLGVSPNSVSRVCRGVRKTIKGHRVAYTSNLELNAEV